MVSNNLKILDEGIIKYVAESKMPIKLTYEKLVYRLLLSAEKSIKKTKLDDDLNEITEIIDNPEYIEPHGVFKKILSKYFEHYYSIWAERSYFRVLEKYNPYPAQHDMDERIIGKFMSKQDILDYLGIIPFTPSVMINISPNWKGMKGRYTQCFQVNLLSNTIDKYLNASNRWDYWSYVIECGAEGDHIHAHIVAHVNNDIAKSVLGKKGHIPKGNQSIELRKIFDQEYKNSKELKPKGLEGCLKGKFAIQTSILRCPELVKDKLSYLEEEKKPHGHKNASHPICPKFVVITSKDQQTL